MTGEEICLTCAGFDHECERCGLLTTWSLDFLCAYCRDEVEKELAKELEWWHNHRRKAA